MISILREITQWDNSAIPNHEYHVTPGGKMIAYRKSGVGDLIHLKTPMRLDRRYRKFESIGSYTNKEPSKDVIYETGSGGNIYEVTPESCTCIGFTFHKSCKHWKKHYG